MIIFSCLNYIVFVPMLYTLVLIVKCYAFSLSTTLLCPLLDFISLMQFPCFVALVECWTCKWFFALNLLACMSGCSFLVWMSIMVTIYSDCLFLVKPWFIGYSTLLDHIVLAPMHYKFSAYNDHTVLLFFRRCLFLWFKSYTDSRIRCKSFVQLFPTHMLSLEFVLGFCHGIAKGEDCKVEFIQLLVWFIPCQICL